MASPSPTASPAGQTVLNGQPEPAAQAPPPPPDELDTSIFPGPPAFYHRYTSANLALPLDATISDESGEPQPFKRSEMEPPNVDWIVEEGNYSVFGETWPVDEKVPTLEEMGVQEMFDRNAGQWDSIPKTPVRACEAEPLCYLVRRPQAVPSNPPPCSPPHLHPTARRAPCPATLSRPPASASSRRSTCTYRPRTAVRSHAPDSNQHALPRQRAAAGPGA